MSFLGKMVKKTATGFIVSSATALAVSSISNILGLSDSLIGKILAVGIPMMTFLAADDPKVTDLLFKESKKDTKKKKNKKESEDEYVSIFGKENTKKMNKAIADETGATEDEVNGVMSLFTPFFVDAVAEEDPKDAGALNKMFKAATDEITSHMPSMSKMFMKALF